MVAHPSWFCERCGEEKPCGCADRGADVNIPQSRVYEVEGEPHPDPLGAVIKDMQAAHHLGIPFTVETVKSRQYRYGGNVNKADVVQYRITFVATDET